MKFETCNKINKWIKDHKNTGCVSVTGEQFAYTFLPTGIIECQTVECLRCGEKIMVCTD